MKQKWGLYACVIVLGFSCLLENAAAVILPRVSQRLYVGLRPQIYRRLNFLMTGSQEWVSESQAQPLAHARNILVLGDGPRRYWSDAPLPWGSMPIAENLSRVVPRSTQVYKTDLSIIDDPYINHLRNLHWRHVDHNKPLPFDSNFFDAIFMRRGICLCAGGEVNCAGVSIAGNAMHKFLHHITRVLNKDNKSAFAFIHGAAHGVWPQADHRAREKYEEVVEKMADLHPQLKFELLYLPKPNLQELAKIFVMPEGEEKEQLKALYKLDRHAQDPANYYFAAILIRHPESCDQALDFSVAGDNTTGCS